MRHKVGVSLDRGSEVGGYRMGLNRIEKSKTPSKLMRRAPDPILIPSGSSQSIAIAYAKVLETMVTAPLSPACEDWRPTILRSRPGRPRMFDTPGFRRTPMVRRSSENGHCNFIGEVKEGQTFEIPAPSCS
jgi:hypothetical protein